MPRKTILMRKKSKQRQTWDPELMKQAVADVLCNKYTLKRASIVYSIPRTTIRRHVESNRNLSADQPIIIAKLGRKPILGDELEQKLLQFAMKLESESLPLNVADMKSLAYQLAEHYNIPHPFANEEAGRGWLDLFLKRHEDKIHLKQNVKSTRPRIVKFNETTITHSIDKTNSCESNQPAVLRDRNSNSPVERQPALNDPHCETRKIRLRLPKTKQKPSNSLEHVKKESSNDQSRAANSKRKAKLDYRGNISQPHGSTKAPCLFCDEIFDDAGCNETWVQCGRCQLIVHTTCWGREAHRYLCANC